MFRTYAPYIAALALLWGVALGEPLTVEALLGMALSSAVSRSARVPSAFRVESPPP
jgi:hypothetical protein